MPRHRPTLVLSALLLLALAADAALAETAPFGLCFSSTAETPAPEDAVAGLRLGVLARHRRMAGLSILLLANDVLTPEDEGDGKDGTADGIQIASLLNAADRSDLFLMQAAFLGNGIGEGAALQIAPLVNFAGRSGSRFTGVQIGAMNQSMSTGGGVLQAGCLANGARRLRGVQIGTLNSTADGGGVQIGLLNASIGRTSLLIPFEEDDTEPPPFRGVQLGVVNRSSGSSGVQLGAVNWTETAFGIQVGAVNWTETASGIQVGAINWTETASGIQVGAVNWAETSSGLQLGIANVVRADCFGAQIGLVNVSERLHGVQIGLFNDALSACRGAQIGLFNVYSGSRQDLSAIQFGAANMAGGSAMFVLPIFRLSF